MDDARSRLQTLFQEALELPAAEHLGFLSAACGDDAELRNEVLAMLEQDGAGHTCSTAASQNSQIKLLEVHQRSFRPRNLGRTA